MFIPDPGDKRHRIPIRNTAIRTVRCPRCLTKWKFSSTFCSKSPHSSVYLLHVGFEKNVFFFTFTFAFGRAAFHRRSQNQCRTWTYGSQKPVLNNNKTWIRNVDSKTISHTVVEVYCMYGTGTQVELISWLKMTVVELFFKVLVFLSYGLSMSFWVINWF